MLKKLIISSVLMSISSFSFAAGPIAKDSIDAVAFQTGGFFFMLMHGVTLIIVHVLTQ